MNDIILLTYGAWTWNYDFELKQLRNRFPFARVIHGKDRVEAHFNAAKNATTQFFYVVDVGFTLSEDFDPTYPLLPIDAQWVIRFNNSSNDHRYGLRIFHKSAFKQSVTDKNVVDFVHNFGALGIKDIDVVAGDLLDRRPNIFLAARNLDDWSVDAQFANLKSKYSQAQDRLRRVAARGRPP